MDLPFHANCLFKRQLYEMQILFAGKTKITIINLSAAKFAYIVQSVQL